MTLDFSKYSLEEILSEQKDRDSFWQQEIFVFLKEWHSSSEIIKVKTSGSTGIPKEIELKKSAMINSAEATIAFLNLKENSTALLCLPAKYIAGKMMFVRAMVGKFKLHCMEPKLSIQTNETFDFCAMTPSQADHSLNIIQQIQTLILGGAPVSFGLKTKLQRFPTKIYETYGMTETITHIALKELNPNPSKYFKCLPNVSLSLDERDCLVIEAPKISNHKIITNDVVNLVDNVTFEWLGRADFVINSGGVKINPEVVEGKLQSQINQPFIISSLPDEQFGEKVVLVIENSKLKVEDLSFNNLEKFEEPKKIYVLKEFPRTENGKVNRRETANLIPYPN